MTTYPPPVDRLLTLGAEPARRRTWPDYRHLGLTQRHVPELIRMVADPAFDALPPASRAAWAPVHAWRALGQLEAAEAVKPLWGILDRADALDFAFSEIPQVLGMIGPPALPEATLRLFDETRDEAERESAMAVLTNVGLQHPERRDEAAAILTKQLEDWAHQSPEMNGMLIAHLLDLNEAAAAPLMEAALAAGAVDETICGTWLDVQEDLGLIEVAGTQPGAFFPGDADEPGPMRIPSGKAAAKARAKQKAAKQSRKQNRKKKK
jgi:hypothetical protein